MLDETQSAIISVIASLIFVALVTRIVFRFIRSSYFYHWITETLEGRTWIWFSLASLGLVLVFWRSGVGI